MGKLLRKVLAEYVESDTLDEAFLADAAEFFMGYTDAVHHGKEEKILFEALNPKKVLLEDKMLVDEILLQHTSARMKISRLSSLASETLETENEEAVVAILYELDDLYTTHIEMEDRFFNGSLQSYFNEDEKAELEKEFKAFDEVADTQRYTKIVTDWVTKKGL